MKRYPNKKPAKYCLAKDKTCPICKKKGHTGTGCPDNPKTDAKSVKVRLVNVDKDDSEPTPTCNMEFKTEEGRKFSKEVLPDTGCSQTIVSEKLTRTNRMSVNPRKKKQIWNASNERMVCRGTTTFEVSYYGQSTRVSALVSPDLNDDDVLLGWKSLQKLKIIPENFPNPIKTEDVIRAACAKMDPRTAIENTMKKFPTVFDEPSLEGGKLKPMKGGPMTIHLKKGEIKPTHIYTARKCPYAFEDYAKEELDKSENMGIIEKVEGATEWCSPCSFVTKPGGGCRLVTDLKGLNDYVERPTHPFPVAKDIINTIPSGSKRFAVFDALKGYWQIPLDEKSRRYTTFLTEFGRYQYLRAPMGLCSSGDEFCRRTDEALGNITGVKKLVDDILIFAPDDDTLLKRIKAVFAKCAEWGCLLYTSPSPRDRQKSRMPSSA